MTLTQRKETSNDHDAIRALTARAFAPKPYSNGTEPSVIEALRESGELTLSLVALEGDTCLGQITFSPVTIDGVHDGWFGLGPIAVEPARQGEGIGAALIGEGLEYLKKTGAKACVLIGDPTYYNRFGFEANTGLSYGDLDARFIQRLVLAGPDKSGSLLYSPSFEKAAASQ